MLSKWHYWKPKNTNRKALQSLEVVHDGNFLVDDDYLNMFSEWFMAIMVSESLTVKVLETAS